LIAEDIDRVLYVVDEVYETGMIAKEVVDKVEMMLARHGLTKEDDKTEEAMELLRSKGYKIVKD